MAVLRDIKRDQEAELERLRAENEAYKRAAETNVRKISFRIGEKGGLSVYGLGRFPVTLYYEQWQALLGQSEAILAYLAANKSRMKMKE
jgi:hypothetical protein